MFKSIRLRITVIFVLLIIISEFLAGAFLVFKTADDSHDTFDQAISSVFSEELREELAQAANAVKIESPDGEESSEVILSESTAENADNLKNILLSTALFKDGYGRELVITDSDANAFYVSSDSAGYKDSSVWKEAKNGNEAKNNKLTGKNAEYSLPLKNGDEVKYIVYISDPLTAGANSIRLILTAFAILLPISAVISYILAMMFAKSVSSPLKSLAQQAKRLADGDTSALSHSQGNDEISELTNALIYLSDSKREHAEKATAEKTKIETILQNMRVGIMAFDTNGKLTHINPEAKNLLNRKFVDDITFNKFFKEINADISLEGLQFMHDNNAAEREVTINEHVLQLNFAPISGTSGDGGVIVIIHDITKHEKLERSRRDFVANVSHELRTPITVIKSYADILADTPEAEPELRTRFLDTISSETDRMAKIISDLLILSKLDENTDYARPSEDIDIRTMLEGLVERLALSAKKKEQTLIYTPINDVPKIKGDRDALERVFTNIISNALKYTPTGGKIQIFSSSVYSDILIKVSDTGIGISKEQLPHIFDRFYRVDKARSRDTGGTGLGLAIAKQTVETAFHGKILISSELNKGTDVTVKLPLPKK